MNILYIVNDLAYFRTHRENVALAMASKGHDVIVASGDWQNTDISDWPSNIKLIPLKLNKHALNIKFDIRLVQKLQATIQAERPDIVHPITIKPILMSAIATQFLRKGRGSPNFKTVWTFPRLGKIFEPTTNILKLARKIVVTRVLKTSAKNNDIIATFENSTDRDLLVKQLGFLPQNTHVVFGAGISLEHFTDNPDHTNSKKFKQIGDSQTVFLMATRLINEKGVDVFLKAAAALKAHPAQPRFVLAGTKDLSNPDCIDQEVIDKSVAAGDIEFLGPIALKDMPALYQTTSVFCLPTRLREGFPRSLIEAAACGCALIASDQASIRQIVKPQKTGWLLQKPDCENLINAIKAALSDLHDTKLMGNRARELILSRKVSDAEITNYFDHIYNQITQ